MKKIIMIIFSLILISLTLTGCADKDAFSKFKLVKDEELAFDNVMFSKVKKDQKVYAVAAAVYLNDVYPKHYKKENFYIIIFAKNKTLLNNFSVTLDDAKPLLIQKLPQQNEYTHLLHIQNSWSNYYLAKFPSQKEKKLTLHISLPNQAKATLTFQKNQ